MKEFKQVGDTLAVEMGKQLLKQGRTQNAGGLINSLQTKVTQKGFTTDITILGNFYWRFVDKGVKPGQIKSAKAPARINALVQWLKKKGIGSTEPIIRGIAYAIAHTHKKVGMPSKNGRFDKSRLGFVDKAYNIARPEIDSELTTILGRQVDKIIKRF